MACPAPSRIIWRYADVAMAYTWGGRPEVPLPEGPAACAEWRLNQAYVVCPRGRGDPPFRTFTYDSITCGPVSSGIGANGFSATRMEPTYTSQGEGLEGRAEKKVTGSLSRCKPHQHWHDTELAVTALMPVPEALHEQDGPACLLQPRLAPTAV